MANILTINCILISIDIIQVVKSMVPHNPQFTRSSFSIVVSDNKTRFKTWFKPSIQLDKKKDYEIALINLETYYSYPNIDRSNN